MKKTTEHKRVSGPEREQWHRWGSYVSNRAWGTIREHTPFRDDGKAWDEFPFAHARSRAYRWTEDGIAGFSDNYQRLCMGLALWNEQDPWLKERFYGLTNEQDNHGEDVKEYYFYLDATPSYSYLKMLYKYPQVEFPYERFILEGAVRGQDVPSFQLIDALHGSLRENRYFDVFVEYAKAGPDDILCRVTAVNRGPDPAPLRLLPQLWFRNTWAYGEDNGARPRLHATGPGQVEAHHAELGTYWWAVEGAEELLFTENETNTALLYDTPNATPYVKDGIDYAVVRGMCERVNPEQQGTKCAAQLRKIMAPGESWVVRLRLSTQLPEAPFADFDAIFAQRLREADEFYAALQRPNLSDEEKDIQRKAFAGLKWNKNFYHFDVERWFAEAEARGQHGSKQQDSRSEWLHFKARDVLSVPDPWEYPYLASWDLAFQIVTICLVDAEFAQQQALLLLDERYMRADGAMPAFEGDFSTPHPPVHAWAIWHIYNLTGREREFLTQAYPRLKLHYEWWLRTHQRGDHFFGGGFQGMDNISLFNRNEPPIKGSWLIQADGTGWMAQFTLQLLAMAIELDEEDDALDLLKHFVATRRALDELWDAKDGFFYDQLHTPDGKVRTLKVRGGHGLVPLIACVPLSPASLRRLPRLERLVQRLPAELRRVGVNGCYLLAAMPHEALFQLLEVLFDREEFYSPYGLRSISKFHEREPLKERLANETCELRYEPGLSASKMFGGNSNWRGPIWAPLNQLIVEALHAYHAYFGPAQKLVSQTWTLEQAADDLVERLIGLFKRNPEGHRAFFGREEYFQHDPHWRDYLWFYEHFHAETGEGLGASHQNGWTSMVAKLIETRGRDVYPPR